jgi:glycosyltransferase involved in cell wall biosynthesis
MAVRRELGIAEDALLIGSIGLLWYIKGYDYLLRAMPAIIKRAPEAQLALVGSGQDESKLRQLAEDLAIASKVHFLGWREDIPRLLSALDVYVQPSLSEGLPMSILEAAATGLPIVATNVGGIPEIITDGRYGMLVAPGDEAALAEAVGDLLADTASRETFGAQVRKHVMQHFSADSMAAAYADVYRSLPPAGDRQDA